MCGVEGLVKPLCKVGEVVGEQGLGAGCGVGSSPPWSSLGAGLRVRRLPMRLASLGASVELGVRGTRGREHVGVCIPAGRFAHTCGAGSAGHRACAGGCVGAQGGKSSLFGMGVSVWVCICVCGLCKPV